MYSHRFLAGIPVPATITAMPLPMLATPVRGGRASAAEQGAVTHLDLATELAQHPQSIYILRQTGDSMEGAGMFDGDMLVVEKHLQPAHDDIVVAQVNGEFTCKRLHMRDGQFVLHPENPAYPDIHPQEGQHIEIWGVVTSSVKRLRKG
jgi:DNA polymerase V